MLKIFNTLGREQQVFIPIEDKIVKMYQCGPTVYSVQHIGNMRAIVAGDLIVRALKYLGYEVKFVRNYTDFGHLTGDNIGDADSGEDRMAKGAKKEGLTPDQVADKYIQQFETDVNALNTITPTVISRATNYIQEMIDMVKILIDKGYAYVTPTAVFFEVDKFPNYTKLSGQNLEMNISGEGHGSISDSNKKKPYDFAIWFFKTGDALQFWQSPFHSNEVKNGEGFPGWHIECSAMIRKNLGDTIDIHMGGIEHIPTHHTNEIAQSESSTGQKYVNYWLHNEHLLVDNNKMSKSEGRTYSLQDLKDKGYDPIALRYLFLQSQYRSKQNFTFEALESAQISLNRLRNGVDLLAKKVENIQSIRFNVDRVARDQFINALEEDFNIPQALAILWDTLKSNLSAETKLSTILDFDKVLGLKLEEHIEQPREMNIPTEAKILLEERNIARIEKDFQKSDELRDKLKSEFGLMVKDTDNGQIIDFNNK